MKKNIKRPTAEWLIKPLDGDTNEIIARHLARTAEIDEVETELGGMYRCSYSRINELLQAVKIFKLKFKVYRRRSKNSQLELWQFDKAEKLKKSKKYKETKKQIKKLDL